jgi:hypothetical protein
MVLIVKIDLVSFFSFSVKIMSGFLFLIIAEGTDQPIDPPLISAE